MHAFVSFLLSQMELITHEDARRAVLARDQGFVAFDGF